MNAFKASAFTRPGKHRCSRMNRPPTTRTRGPVDQTRLMSTLEDGTKVSYAQYGDPRGRPLIFFHGWPGSRLQARIFDAPARLCGIKVLAPDRPGIGLSTGGCFPGVADWVDTLADWFEAMDIISFYTLGIRSARPIRSCAYLAWSSGSPCGPLVDRAPHTAHSGSAGALLRHRRPLFPSPEPDGRNSGAPYGIRADCRLGLGNHQGFAAGSALRWASISRSMASAMASTERRCCCLPLMNMAGVPLTPAS